MKALRILGKFYEESNEFSNAEKCYLKCHNLVFFRENWGLPHYKASVAFMLLFYKQRENNQKITSFFSKLIAEHLVSEPMSFFEYSKLPELILIFGSEIEKIRKLKSEISELELLKVDEIKHKNDIYISKKIELEFLKILEAKRSEIDPSLKMNSPTEIEIPHSIFLKRQANKEKNLKMINEKTENPSAKMKSLKKLIRLTSGKNESLEFKEYLQQILEIPRIPINDNDLLDKSMETFFRFVGYLYLEKCSENTKEKNEFKAKSDSIISRKEYI